MKARHPAGVTVRRVGAESAGRLLPVVRAAFADRPPLDPPADALTETTETLASALAVGGGLVAEVDGEAVGALVLDPRGDRVYLRRFGVVPGARGRGVAGALLEAALAAAREAPGRPGVVAVLAREELPAGIVFWEAHGFVRSQRAAPYVELQRDLWPAYHVPDADAMRDLGSRVAGTLRAGDLLLLVGGLGAGKTTFTQGLGVGLGVRGAVTSPTFVIARVHPASAGGPALVHVDAYRLGGLAELDDLDLDASLDEAVTVVEWGQGLAEGLAESRLEVRIDRSPGAPGSGTDPYDADPGDAGPHGADPRRVRLVGVGPRWSAVPLPRAG